MKKREESKAPFRFLANWVGFRSWERRGRPENRFDGGNQLPHMSLNVGMLLRGGRRRTGRRDSAGEARREGAQDQAPELHPEGRVPASALLPFGADGSGL